MAASTYDEALRRLLAHEGGYTNHPSDPGGPTNFGITLADYRKHIRPDATTADVRAMSVDQAKTIYRKRYWDAQRCDELPAGVDYSIFDYGVNSGIGRSGKVLRRVVGLPDSASAVTDQVLAYMPRHAASATWRCSRQPRPDAFRLSRTARSIPPKPMRRGSAPRIRDAPSQSRRRPQRSFAQLARQRLARCARR